MILKIKAMVGSRRFWLTAGTVVMSSLSWYSGRLPDPQAIEFIAMSVGAWVVGDSLRETALKAGYQPIVIQDENYEGPIPGGFKNEEDLDTELGQDPSLRRADQ